MNLQDALDPRGQLTVRKTDAHDALVETILVHNNIVLSGRDRQLLGQVAANIRALREPDPYKNKGVRYTGEALRKKVGKTGASAK